MSYPNPNKDDRLIVLVIILIVVIWAALFAPEPASPSAMDRYYEIISKAESSVNDHTQVHLSDLKFYDGQRVGVTGWVRRVEVKKGRYGSEYFEILVVEGCFEVMVHTGFPVYVSDSYATFLGKYHSDGWVGAGPTCRPLYNGHR